jgi:thioredoxin reductase
VEFTSFSAHGNTTLKREVALKIRPLSSRVDSKDSTVLVVRFRIGIKSDRGFRTMIDVIIVGGGPAGLSAGLILGRSTRRVVICDGGHPRNATSHAAHGLFSRENVAPSELRRIAREQLRPFSVEFRDGEVVKAIRTAESLEVELTDGTALSARRLLLATGVVDILPDIDGLKEMWGTSIFNCPYCHGWEMRGQPLAVYGKGDSAVDLAVLLTAWTSDIIMCTNAEAGLSSEQVLKLSAAQIGLKEQTISRLKASAGLLDAIEFDDGSVLPRRGLFLQPQLHYRNAVATELGCRLEESGAVQIDEKCRTSVAGVYAAGNCAGTSGQIIAMAAAGAKAGYAINRDLVDENLQNVRVQSDQPVRI